MDPISIVVTALAMGAAAGLKDTAAQVVKDGYAALKAPIQSKYTDVSLELLEADPGSEARRSVVEEDLKREGAVHDQELLSQARDLLEVIDNYAPDTTKVVGVSIEDVKTASLEIEKILASGAGDVTGVEIRRADVANDIKISDIRAGDNSGVEVAQPLPVATEPIKILFLAANPADTAQLRLDEEVRAIDQALRLAEFRDIFEIHQHWAVRISDLQELLLRHRPHIVHFSGHGSTQGEILLEDDFNESKPVSPESLGKLFALLKDNIRCVLLNACYSQIQAEAIAEHIDFVVGMSTAIGDNAAITFATAFYRALGYGRNVRTAFELGRSAINLEALGEEDTPKLIAFRCDPAQVVFASKAEASSNDGVNIQGDYIEGDKVSVGNISGTDTAVGRNAQISIQGIGSSGLATDDHREVRD